MTGNKKKVALFSTNFVASSQTFIYDQICHHQRYEADVYCHNRMNREQFPYDSVYAFDPRGGVRQKVEWLLYGTTTVSPTFIRNIKNSKYDIIHAHFGPGSIYALLYKKIADIPLVVTYHGYDVPLLLTRRRFQPQYWRYWLLSKEMLKRVDRFLPVSQDLADKLIQLGAPREKVKVAHLGTHVPDTLERSENKIPQLLMVGRFVEKKGFGYGVEAFSKFIQQGGRAKLNIIGNGPLEEQLRSIAREQRVEDHIEFLGQKPHTFVLEQMCHTDIMLAPSVVAKNGDTEGILTVLKEANAHAVPAIITRHGGNPDIVEDGKTGFIVPERDVDALAEKIKILITDDALRKTMGRDAREKMAQELAYPIRLKALEQHYDEVIDEYRSR